MTAELIWLKNWRLELLESIAELEGYDLPEKDAPNEPSVRKALKWTREELEEVDIRIARIATRAPD